jgi:hypothetical protein
VESRRYIHIYIDLMGKTYAKVETATLFSELTVSTNADDNIIDLRERQSYLCVPVKEKRYLFEDISPLLQTVPFHIHLQTSNKCILLEK